MKEQQAIISLNPFFTALLDESDPEGVMAARYPLYTSADDPLPPYGHFWYRSVPEATTVTVTAADIDRDARDQRENPQNWPHKAAKPILAITGSIPVIKL